jgi:hypothetical protein
MIIKFLMIVHIIVDFYLQNDQKTSVKYTEHIEWNSLHKNELIRHTVLYTLLSSTLLFFVNGPLTWLVVILLLFLSHGLIDFLKIKMTRKRPQCKAPFFALDQVIHISTILLISYLIGEHFLLVRESPVPEVFIDYFLAVLLIWKTANIVFTELFDAYKPQLKLGTDNGHKNAGAMIGNLERLLILICLLTNNFATIGFVIAAKSVARFEKLSKPQFGEYFILGTLFSVIYTIIAYYLIF